MRKRFKAALPILVVAIGIFLLASSAEASFWLKGMGFHYSPDYGSLGDGLEKVKPYYETPEKLESGTGVTFSAGWDFSEKWGVRLDAFSFEGVADYHHKRLVDTFKFETSTSPILLSLVYRVPTEGQFHPYLGAGVGSFPSELKITSNVHTGADYSDSPIGFQVFTGANLRLEEGLFFSGELRYISAKAEYPSYRCIEDCSTDWSGVFISIGIGYRFGPLRMRTKAI